MTRMPWISWIATVALVAFLGCGRPAESKQESSSSVKKQASQAGEKPAEPAAAPSERPWVKNPPPRGQKPIHDLPLDIQIDLPTVPPEIARPSPPIPKE